MKHNQSLLEFYQIPENSHLTQENLHIVEKFNIFKRWNCSSVSTFMRYDFYRIILIIGKGVLKFKDQIIEIEEPVIILANKTIPYSWEPTSENQQGWVCVFSSNFLNGIDSYIQDQSLPLMRYEEIFIHFLNDELLDLFLHLFQSIEKEYHSDYLYKNNLLQSYLLVLIHQIQKLEPTSWFSHTIIDAVHRNTYNFLELLERQFPIQSPELPLMLRTPKDYAEKLSIHVNSLNHSVKKVTGKTSSKLIADRIISEAKELLKNTEWSISEISDALGFQYYSHFTNYYRKHTGESPKIIRTHHLI